MYTLILLTSTLLWLVVRSEGYPDSVHLINLLNKFYHFDHHIFCMDGSSTDLARWFPTSASSSEIKMYNFTPQTVYTFGNLSDSTFNTAELLSKTKSSKNPFLIVVVDGLLFDNESRLLAQVKVIHKIGINVKIGVFFAVNITSLDVIEELFRWSWSAGIVNIFSAFYLSDEGGDPLFNVFKYIPFVTFELINVTSSESPRDYFLDEKLNYRGHPLRCLRFIGAKTNVLQLKFSDTVRLVFNASMSNINRVPAEYEKFGLLNEDIVPYEETLSENAPLSSYPHRQTGLLLIVPHAQPYSNFVDYLRNGTWTILFVYTFIVIAASSFLLIISGYLRKKKILLFECVVDVVNLLINDNATIGYRNLHPADIFVIVPLTFTGLIVMNGILSVFQSYITAPIYQPQIDSFADLYKSSVPILACDVCWKDLLLKLLEDLTKFGGWNSKVHGVSIVELANQTNAFNNSIAFVMHSLRAQQLFEVQRRFKLKAYHIPTETFLTRFLSSFRIRADFPFSDPLNDIVHRLNGAGLIDRWVKEENLLWMGTLLRGKPNHQIQIDNGSHTDEFAVPTVVWCGWIASAVVFISELVCHKINSYQRSSRA